MNNLLKCAFSELKLKSHIYSTKIKHLISNILINCYKKQKKEFQTFQKSKTLTAAFKQTKNQPDLTPPFKDIRREYIS